MKSLLLIAISGIVTLGYGQDYKSVELSSFFTVKKIEIIEYKVFSDPDVLDEKGGSEFKLSDLKQPETALQSMLNSTSAEWLDELGEKPGHLTATPKEFEYRKSKKFERKYYFSILGELKFTFDGDLYVVLITRHNTLNVRHTFPYLLVKKGDDWKISANKHLIEFSGYTLMKPEHFLALIKPSPPDLVIESNRSIRKYFFDNGVRVDLDFSLHAMLGHKAKDNPLIPVLFADKNKPFSQDVTYKDEGYNILDLGYIWTIKSPSLTIYSNKIFYDAYHDSTSVFKGAGDYLAAWVFARNSDERDLYTIGVGTPEYQSESFQKREEGRIAIDYMYSFHTHDGNFKIVYFEEFETYIGKQGFSRERYVGYKRHLLVQKEKKWFVSFSPTEEQKKIVWALDHLNKNAMFEVFSMSHEAYRNKIDKVRGDNIDLSDKVVFFHYYDISVAKYYQSSIRVDYLYRGVKQGVLKLGDGIRRTRLISNKYESIYGDWFDRN